MVNTGDDDPLGVAVPVSLAKNGRLEQPWFGANYFACESAPVPFGGLATGGDVGPDTPDLGVVVTFNQGGADAFAMQWIALASRRAVQRGWPCRIQIHHKPDTDKRGQPHTVLLFVVELTLIFLSPNLAPGGQPPGAQHSGPNEAYSTPSQPHSVMVPTTMLAPTAPPAEPETDSAQAAGGSAAAAGSDVDGGAPPSYSSIYGKKND